MANNKLIVDERQRDIGNFMIGRLLPFNKKRQVGPFTFIDHMGPAVIQPDNAVDVDQHPHIGLSTLTYLFKGAIEHKDSTGAQQVVQPGDVGFMTAGKGVTHTERTPAYLRKGNPFEMHGYQVWVALPVELEEMEPQFNFYPKSEIPTWKDGPLEIKLVAGEAFGKKSPLVGYSPLFMVDVKTTENYILDLKNKIKGEVAFVIVSGSIVSNGQTVNAGQMLISKTKDECEITLKAGTQLLLFGGEPLPEERFLMWNFASHSKDRLQQAKEDWEQKRFPKVPNDDTYIPFPQPKL